MRKNASFSLQAFISSQCLGLWIQSQRSDWYAGRSRGFGPGYLIESEKGISICWKSVVCDRDFWWCRCSTVCAIISARMCVFSPSAPWEVGSSSFHSTVRWESVADRKWWCSDLGVWAFLSVCGGVCVCDRGMQGQTVHRGAVSSARGRVAD